MLIIHTTPTAGYGWDVVRSSWSQEDPEVKLPAGQHALSLAGWLTKDAAERLFGMAGKHVDEMLEAANKPDFKPVSLGIHVHGHIESKVRQIETRNVAAVVQGSDEQLRSE